METEIITLIIAVSILLLVLSLVVVMVLINHKTKQQLYSREKEAMQQEFFNQLTQSQLETREEAFQQLGQELHDNVGQLLSTTKMLLGITERNLAEVPDTLKTAQETLGKAIQDIRALSKTLNQEWLGQFSLVENLRNELERINTAGYIQADLKTGVAEVPLTAETQVILFRIVQEALQNSIKHAGATKIKITINKLDNELELVLTDDGSGIDAVKGKANGVGIINMKHRTKLLGGSITWQPATNGGTAVYIRIPVTRKNSEL